jgi:hypothetical protein
LKTVEFFFFVARTTMLLTSVLLENERAAEIKLFKITANETFEF